MDREPTGTTCFITAAVPGSRSSKSWAGPALVVTGLLLFGFVLASISSRGARRVDTGWTAAPIGGVFVITNISEGSSGVLQRGDRIVSVAGDSDAGVYGPALALSRLSPGDPYRITVVRDGIPMSAVLKLGRGKSREWHIFLPDLVAAVLLFAAGAWIAFAKTHDWTARLASATFVLSSLAMLGPEIAVFPGWNAATAPVAFIISVIWRPWYLPVAYHFLSRFPRPLPEGTSARILRWSTYVIAGVLWIPLNIPVMAHVFGVYPNGFIRFLLPFNSNQQPGAALLAIFDGVASAAMCLLVIRNYRKLPDLDSRRRIRWAGFGFGAALAIFVLISLTKLALYITGSAFIETIYPALSDVGVVFVGIAPITLGYAVVKHRVLGIDVVIRRGVQYLLAKNALRLITFAPLLILIVHIIETPEQSIRAVIFQSSWIFYAAVVVSGAISLRYRKQMANWLDRKFFRAAFDQEQILLGLIEQVKAAESEQQMCVIVAREVGLAFRSEGFDIFLRASKTGQLAVAYSQLTDRAVRVRDYLNEQTVALSAREEMLFECAPGGVHYGQSPTIVRESLIVPINDTKQTNLGMLILGRKLSDEPYTRRDRDLLNAIASQMGVMLEMMLLKQRLQDEGKTRVAVLGHLDRQRIQLLSECPECGRCYLARDRICEDDGAKLSLTLPVEKVVEGKYRLDRRIGHGGMGVVYQATDLRLERPVAVKIMISSLFGNSTAVARFQREARAVARLDHPHIVGVHDFGNLATGGAYLVMELVRGESLRARLGSNEAIPVRSAALWMSQLCSAIAAAHGQGIVHRDLKPENLMVARENENDRIVVLDFGLAKVISDLTSLDPELTMSGTVLGTQSYMSPEQRMGLEIDWRTDIYSIAVICTEILTGVKPPRQGASMDWVHTAFQRIAADTSGLQSVVRQALADQPGQRFASVGDLAAGLARTIPASLEAASST